MKNLHWGRSAALGSMLMSVAAASVFVACSDDPDAGPGQTTTDAGAVDGATGAETGPTDVPCAPEPARSCTNAACTQQAGEPAICVDNQCVKLKTPDCPRVSGPVENDDAIVIGVVHSNRGSNATAGGICNDAIELAVNEINKAGGIPSNDRCKKPRPLAFVACDDTMLKADGTPVTVTAGEKTPREKTLDHLAAELKVPAIVGGVSSGDVTDMAKYVIPTHKTMFFTTRGSSNFLREPEKAPQPLAFNASPEGVRLFWRATQNVDIQAKGLQKAYTQLETKLKAERGDRPIKLALIMKNDAYGQGLGGLFQAGLMVNGAAADATNVSYKAFSYQFTGGVPGLCLAPACTATDTKANTLEALKAFKPDVMVHVGTDEIIADLVTPYEDFVVAQALPAAEKPFYLGAHGLKNAKLTALVDTLPDAVKTDVRSRTRGFFPGRSTPASQDMFNFRFKPAYASASPIPGVFEGYDAMYVLAYAMSAAGAKGPITSRSIVENIPATLTGTEHVNVGPNPFATTSKRVAAGEKINLDGVFSPLDFDAFGEAPSDATIWCVGIDPNTSKAFFNDATGAYYDAAKNTLEGTYVCP